jgi:hypothetical protein
MTANVNSVDRRCCILDGPHLYNHAVPQLGAVGPDGKPWATPEGVRNTAMTIYKIPMLADGFSGRPK